MKFIVLFISVLSITIISCDNKKETSKDNKNTQESLVDTNEALLRHVVLFNFNESADYEKIEEIETAFAALQGKIPSIKDFEWGVNNSPEGLDKGFTHCFLVTFGSEEDREKYLPHPDHLAFVKLIGPYVEDVTVIDYWAL